MNKIISSGEGSALERLRDQKKRDIGQTKDRTQTANGDRFSSADGRYSVSDEVSAAGNRLTLRHERTLQGLLAVRTLLDRPAGDREAGLTALIEQTRFQDEPVLADYAKTLRYAVRDSDRAALDYLVRDFQDKLRASARDQIVRENLQAVSSLMPDEILKDIVRSLRSEGLPRLSIARQRALELLRTP